MPSQIGLKRGDNCSQRLVAELRGLTTNQPSATQPLPNLPTEGNEDKEGLPLFSSLSSVRNREAAAEVEPAKHANEREWLRRRQIVESLNR